MTRLVRLGDVATISQGMGMSGRAAGARAGDWIVQAVSVGDIQDDRLLLAQAPAMAIEQNVKTEKHLLRPDDLLVTARSSAAKAALAPPEVSRTVADASLNCVRAREPGLGPYLWWYFTSPRGRQQMQSLMTGATILSLSAGRLAELELPVPEARELDRIAALVEVSERAYAAGLEAVRLRRGLFRDALIERLRREGAETRGATG